MNLLDGLSRQKTMQLAPTGIESVRIIATAFQLSIPASPTVNSAIFSVRIPPGVACSGRSRGEIAIIDRRERSAEVTSSKRSIPRDLRTLRARRRPDAPPPNPAHAAPQQAKQAGVRPQARPADSRPLPTVPRPASRTLYREGVGAGVEYPRPATDSPRC